MMLTLSVAVLVGVWSCGCQNSDSDNHPIAIQGRLTIDLPPGSRHQVEEGIDSIVGAVVLGETQITLQYDIGGFAGNYARYEGNGPFVWQNRETNEGVVMDTALADHDGRRTLYISFPNFGPANFWTDIRNQSEIELILEVAGTVRRMERG